MIEKKHSEDLPPESLLHYKSELVRSDSVAAMLLLEDGCYILQLRDSCPDIWFPGHWGCFGGGIDAGENPEEAIIRELQEELEFSNPVVKLFDTFHLKDKKFFQELVHRHYFEIQVSYYQMDKFVLNEGVEFRALPFSKVKNLDNVVPFDSFAMWLHSG